jgi:hypothetical protein
MNPNPFAPVPEAGKQAQQSKPKKPRTMRRVRRSRFASGDNFAGSHQGESARRAIGYDPESKTHEQF